MNNKAKIIVAHPAQQHSYRLATALKNENMLFKYITTVYDKRNSYIMRGVKIFLSKSNLKRAQGRRCEELDDSQVKQFYQIRGFVELLLLRINTNLYRLWSKRTTDKFGKKVAKYAIRNRVDAVIMYDTKAEKCFEILKRKAPKIKRIIDMSAPNLIYMDKIFKNDIVKQGDKDKLEKEFSSKIYNKKLESSKKEIELASYFLCASNFSKKSLIEYGVDENKVFICPYGIDTNKYKNINNDVKINEKLHVILIGRATQKKGFFYFLNAIKELELNKYKFTIVGDFDKENEYYKKYKDIYNFTGLLMKDDLIDIASKADVLVFPSLADGFGFSALEGLSMGLPVICSQNAGVSDLIIDGYNGFAIPAADSNSIKEKIIWFENNREELQQMKQNSRTTAKKYSWQRYNKKIFKSMCFIINNNVVKEYKS